MCAVNSGYTKRLRHQRGQTNKNVLKYRPSTNHLSGFKQKGRKGSVKSKLEQTHAAANVTDQIGKRNATGSKRYAPSSCGKASEKDTGAKVISLGTKKKDSMI